LENFSSQPGIIKAPSKRGSHRSRDVAPIDFSVKKGGRFFNLPIRRYDNALMPHKGAISPHKVSESSFYGGDLVFPNCLGIGLPNKSLEGFGNLKLHLMMEALAQNSRGSEIFNLSTSIDPNWVF
jgi:hypothetical protein